MVDFLTLLTSVLYPFVCIVFASLPSFAPAGSDVSGGVVISDGSTSRYYSLVSFV